MLNARIQDVLSQLLAINRVLSKGTNIFLVSHQRKCCGTAWDLSCSQNLTSFPERLCNGGGVDAGLEHEFPLATKQGKLLLDVHLFLVVVVVFCEVVELDEGFVAGFNLFLWLRAGLAFANKVVVDFESGETAGRGLEDVAIGDGEFFSGFDVAKGVDNLFFGGLFEALLAVGDAGVVHPREGFVNSGLFAVVAVAAVDEEGVEEGGLCGENFIIAVKESVGVLFVDWEFREDAFDDVGGFAGVFEKMLGEDNKGGF